LQAVILFFLKLNIPFVYFLFLENNEAQKYRIFICIPNYQIKINFPCPLHKQLAVSNFSIRNG